ncbi:MAG: GTP cyclohydrolase I, partial [Anaerolineales bacterium]
MEDRKSIGDIIWLNDVGVEENYGFGDNDYGSISDPDESEKLENIESAVRLILSNVNEDPDRQGLIGTPNRIARMYSEILGGYSVDLGKLVNGALFDVTYDEMIVVKDIE